MKYVIIGSGPGGIFAAEAIRRRDSTSPITLVSDESAIAQSPVMLTYWIGGNVPQEGIFFRDSSWAEKNRVDLKLARQAIALQTPRKRLTLKSGEEIPYERLLIASGSSPISLPITGAGLKGVHCIHRVSDAKAILSGISSLRQVLIIGGGFVGLKLAGHLKERGIRAMILEKETRLAPRMFDQRASLFLIDLLAQQGIRVETGIEPEEILGKAGRVCGVRVKDGRTIPGQMVIQSVGVRPNTQFLTGSGIVTEKGIPVNARMETNVPDVYAAGDVAETLDSITGEKVNNATWPVASRQGTIAGTNMAGGNLACQHNFPTNPLNLFGVHVLAAGHCNEEAEGEALAEEAKGSYRRVLLKSGRLTGFILIGEVSRAGFLLSLMKKKEIVSDPGELLQKTFSYQKRLPQGYGYRHGSLFPDFPGERR